MVVHAYNPSIQKAEADGWQVPSQPGLLSKILSQKDYKKRLLVPICRDSDSVDLETLISNKPQRILMLLLQGTVYFETNDFFFFLSANGTKGLLLARQVLYLLN
jgi:hypothetical protein